MPAAKVAARLVRLFRFILSPRFFQAGLHVEHSVLFTWFLWVELPAGLQKSLRGLLEPLASYQFLLGLLAALALLLGFLLHRQYWRRREAERRITSNIRAKELEVLSRLANVLTKSPAKVTRGATNKKSVKPNPAPKAKKRVPKGGKT